jgi:hypothetical protein
MYGIRDDWLPLLECGEKLLGEFLRVRLHLRVLFIDEIPAKTKSSSIPHP